MKHEYTGADRRQSAKHIARKIVVINIVMLILGTCFGYWLAMKEAAGLFTK